MDFYFHRFTMRPCLCALKNLCGRPIQFQSDITPALTGKMKGKCLEKMCFFPYITSVLLRSVEGKLDLHKCKEYTQRKIECRENCFMVTKKKFITAFTIVICVDLKRFNQNWWEYVETNVRLLPKTLDQASTYTPVH